MYSSDGFQEFALIHRLLIENELFGQTQFDWRYQNEVQGDLSATKRRLHKSQRDKEKKLKGVAK